MKPTIRDVAEYAGVSVATVSRYLNKSPLIADRSIKKVEKAIRELAYMPSMIARGLQKGKTNTVALAVDFNNAETYGNDFFLRIQYGLERELSSQDYFLLIAHIGKGENAVTRLEEIIKEGRIDGLIILSELVTETIRTLLDESGLPYVVTGRMTDDVVWVDVDNCAAGYRATERLLATGIKDVGFLTNSFDKKFVAERFAGYKQALNDAGLSLENQFVIDQLSSREEIASYLIEHRDRLCEGYVVSDSTIAFYLMRFMESEGIRVPMDTQIIAFDNNTLSEALDITVIDIDVMRLGMESGRLLLEQFEEKTCDQQTLLPVRIIERKTVKLQRLTP
jgi:DNA-binding LacI/PurR family transcriptional regulator